MDPCQELEASYKFEGVELSEQLRVIGRSLLAEMADRPIRCLEIGVHQGRSGCWLLDNLLKHPASSYVGVDIQDSGARPNLAIHGDKARLVIGDSRTVVPSLPGLFDLAYVDGDHSFEACSADLVNVWEKLAPGGVVVCDDYNRDDYGVRKAVTQFLARHMECETLYRGYIIVFKRP